MKLSIAGKGGSGKTSISGTLARLLAREGLQVLAIDGDSNPNLALTLGIPSTTLGDELPTLPRGLVDRSGDTPRLTHTLEEICDEHSVAAPDGVSLIVMANPKEAGKGCLCSQHATVRSLIEVAGEQPGEVCILDTEASPEHLTRGTTRHADTVLVVVEPYFKSLETGRRVATLATDLGIDRVALIANKVRDERDLEATREFAELNGLEIACVVPFDPSFADAERAGVAPLDHAPDSPAITALGGLARDLVLAHA